MQGASCGLVRNQHGKSPYKRSVNFPMPIPRHFVLRGPIDRSLFMALLVATRLAWWTPVQAQGPPAVDLLHAGLHDVLGGDSLSPSTPLSTELTDHQARQLREAPGIVTILLAEEIEAAGARDLQEALMLLPGVTLARDVDDAIGIAIRGNWAHEGKCLVMLNGSYLNENSYGTFALGQRIGLANVSRIEMISGPGSVNYGGVAALGVINIITKDAVESDGVTVVTQSGLSHGIHSRNSVQIHGGQRTGKTAITYAAYFDRGVRSAWQDTLPDGRPIDLADSTQIHSGNFTMGFRSGRTQGQLFAGEYNHRISEKGSEILRRDLILDLGHVLDIGQRSTLEIKGGGRVQLPWSNINDTSLALTNSNTIDQRVFLSAYLSRNIASKVTLNVGLQGYYENSRFVSPRSENVFEWNGEQRMEAMDVATFAEFSVQHRIGNFTAGGRYEKNWTAGEAFAPRFGYTKVLGRFHFKLLLSSAFKLPTLQNLNYGPSDSPLLHETVRTREMEMGLLLGNGFDIASNFFMVDIHDPIVYVYDEVNGTDNYINRPRSGTHGVDLKLNWDHGQVGVRSHISLYAVNTSTSDIPEAELENRPEAYQGVAQQAAGLTAWYRFDQRFTLQANADHRGKSNAFCTNANGELAPFLEAPTTLMNATLRWSPDRQRNLRIGFGCNNLGDVKRHLLSTYSNGSAPLPMTGREWTVELSYRFHQ